MNSASFEAWLLAPQRNPLVMGILNVTPDSFSDGGKFLSADAAAEHARSMIQQGADVLDLGAESTRAGSTPVHADEQIARLGPIVRAIRRHSDILLSIDTTSSQVARAMLDAGADVINDISAGRFDPQMLALAARRNVPIALMHMLGEPGTMQQNPVYGDVVSEVMQFLGQRRDAALAAGVSRHHILLDVGIGIGFGKTVQHNLALLRHLGEFRVLGCPILLGTSRKTFIGEITGVATPAGRVAGSCATIAWGITNGADLVRVHDVAETVQTVRMIRAIANG